MQHELGSVRYWTYGSKKKPYLLLIHGFTGSHDGFQYIIPELEKEYYVIAPDLPGFGKSDLMQTSFTVDALAKTTNDFIELLQLEKRPYVVSHSMGGLIAASMLAQSPELYAKRTLFVSPVAEKVLLFDPRRIGAWAGIFQYRLGKNEGRIGEKIVKSERISRVATSFQWTTKDTSLRRAITQHHLDNLKSISSIDYYYQLFKDINTKGVVDYADRLTSFSISIITGDSDIVTPLSGEKRLRDILGAEMTIVKGVGHLMHYERPEAITAAIRQFIL